MQEKVYFKNSKGQHLVGIIDRDEYKATQKLVMIFSRFNSYKYSVPQEYLAKFFISLGYAVFRFDYSGRGESEGDITHSGISSGLDDTNAAMEFMKNQLWVNIHNIGIFGSGLGATFAIMEAAKHHDYKFLILSVPRAEIQSLYGNVNIEEWRKNDFYHANGINYHISIHDDALQYDIYKEAKKIETPTLIVSADGESIHKEEQDKKLKKAIKDSQMIVLKDCENIYCAEAKEKLLEVLEKWLEKKDIIYPESEWAFQF